MFDKNNIHLKKAIIIAACLVGIPACLFAAYKLSIYFAPIIAAFVISTVIEPVIRLLVLKLKFRRKLAAPIVLLLVISAFGAVLTMLVTRLVNEIISITSIPPEYYTRLYNNINLLIDRATKIYLGLPQGVAKNIEGMITNFSISLVDILNSFLNGILNTAISIPQTIIFILITIVSTYFLSSDREKVYGFFRSLFPDNWVKKVASIKKDLFSAFLGYIKALLILMLIACTQLYLGFTIIGIKHALIAALLICISDALPIVGTGGILIPWSVYAFFTGDVRIGVSLLILYGIIFGVKQLVEPKIVSHQIGLYPLVTLTTMYAGLQLFGFAGMILGPITILVMKNILSGLLKNTSIKEIISKTRT